jgi:hypothetical protein
LDDTENNDNIYYIYNFTFETPYWLTTNPMSGKVQPFNQTDILININTTGLKVGKYRVNLTILTNDPLRKVVWISVNLTVIQKEYGISLSPMYQSKYEMPGNTAVYTISLLNDGRKNEVFDLSASDNIWTTKIYDSTGTTVINNITIATNATKIIIVKVTVSNTAKSGDSDNATIKAISRTQSKRYDISFVNTKVPYSIPFFDSFERGVLGQNWTVSSSGGYAGVNTDTARTGSWSMYTNGGPVRVYTIPLDTTITNRVYVEFWIRKGGNFGNNSDIPETGDDLKVEYLNKTGSWITIDTFYGGGIAGEVYYKNYNLTSDAIHTNFRLSFRQVAGLGIFSDYWHIDDTYVGFPPPTPLYISGYNLAPMTVMQDDDLVNMAIIGLVANDDNVDIKSITLNLTGNCSDTDIEEVSLAWDEDSSGTYTVGDIIFASGSFTAGVVTFTGSWTIFQFLSKSVIVLYNISLNAEVGVNVGVRLSKGDCKVGPGSRANHLYEIQSRNSTVLEKPDSLSVQAISKAPVSAEQGEKEVPVMILKLNASSRDIIVTSIRLGFVGAGKSSDISMLKLYDDINANSKFDAGTDLLIKTGTFVYASLTLSDLSYVVTEGNMAQLLIVIDIHPTAEIGKDVGIKISNGDISVNLPDTVLPFSLCYAGPIGIIKKIDITPPPAPINLKIENIKYNSISLTWDRVAETDLMGYNVYRKVDEASDNWGEPLNGFTLVDEALYIDSTVKEATTYYYVVSALDEVPNESEYSNIVYGTTPLGAYAPELNNTVNDFSITEDSVDDSTINLYHWFKDKNHDELRFKCEGQNHIEVLIDQDTGSVTLVPEENWNGRETLTFSASDGSFESTDSVVVTVTPINDPPENAKITSPESGFITSDVNTVYFSASCYDPDTSYGDKLTFKWTSNISGAIGTGKDIKQILLVG